MLNEGRRNEKINAAIQEEADADRGPMTWKKALKIGKSSKGIDRLRIHANEDGIIGGR